MTRSKNSKVTARHLFVYGTVQGVGFRWWVVSVARAYHITGWVRNTENYHCVEIMAESNNEAELAEFIETIKHKHPYARVDACEVTVIAPSLYKTFQVVR